MTRTISFDHILELIDALSQDEQDDLINIVHHRQAQRRRDEMANNIAKSHEEYHKGQVFRGTVDEIIAELNRLIA